VARRIGVIGSFVWDVIYGRDPRILPIEEWGGIAYALSGLDAALSDDWEIVPLIKVGSDLADHAKRFLATLRRIADDAAVIEVPSDHSAGYGRFRTAEAHATDVAAVMTVLRQLAPVPLWLVGTSKGTVSAVNVAARLKTGGPDGIVLTSSITRTAQQTSETVFDAGLSEVRVPTLVVHHEQDACVVTPAADAQGLIGRVRAPRKELRLIQGGAGGASGETACGPFSAHGYFGVDGEVVKVIADWIRQP